MTYAAFKCDKCKADAQGEHDGLGGENAPKGWVDIQTRPLDRSNIGGARGGTTSERLCPRCAARGRDLEEKILALGREAKASGGEILADDISNGPHKIPPHVWEWATRPARFTAADVEEIIESATECVDAHRDHLRCLHEIAALRELGNRLALFETAGKYCRTCGEKSSWDSIKARDPEAQNHAEWCVVPEWLSLVPEDNTLPLRFRYPEVDREEFERLTLNRPIDPGDGLGARNEYEVRRKEREASGEPWSAQGPEERDA